MIKAHYGRRNRSYNVRKAEKDQLLDFVTVLKRINFQDADMELLLDVYNGTELLLSRIEESEDEKHIALTWGAAFRELLEHLYFSLTEGRDEDRDEYCMQLQQCAQRLYHAVSEELKERKEVVFLPYKASMWDSLESVWMAARDDENCDAYVIPIPYYDKNSDGSFGEMHYEGDEYPDYVPITAWETFDIAERKPDVIYIHNPYDNYNMVTSVHPMFYSSELHKYTGELVYIPYFVLAEIEPDNQTAIDNMNHFIRTPAVLYANKVIVQSENMKQIYVNEYIKWAEEMGLKGKHLERGYQEHRILGTGSPKIEKVRNARKEAMKVPKSWERYMYKSNGEPQKVVLYNNSLTALLENGEKMLCKMEQVFSVFEGIRESICLWWRPHPLIQSTIQAMRPELWLRYKNMVDVYLEGDWGIYDNTADLERAIAYADAYYGDMSSLVQLFQETDKPIMILNCEVQ